MCSFGSPSYSRGSLTLFLNFDLPLIRESPFINTFPSWRPIRCPLYISFPLSGLQLGNSKGRCRKCEEYSSNALTLCAGHLQARLPFSWALILSNVCRPDVERQLSYADPIQLLWKEYRMSSLQKSRKSSLVMCSQRSKPWSSTTQSQSSLCLPFPASAKIQRANARSVQACPTRRSAPQ